MRDFSIDNQAEKIYSVKTKEYFEEVIKSYYSENYRSAVVMLYSITIADLVYKIEELKELYNDGNAISILEEISRLQENNPNSPDWESKLIELTKEKTNLLEPADYLHIQTLQKHRHLCAHPVLTQNYELYRPNKETTRAHIRNILEGVLTKPSLLSRKIFEDLLKDLSEVKKILYKEIQIENHLKAKYLDRLSQPVLVKIFRSLWKVTFKTDDSNCNENRDINLRALLIIFKNNNQFIIDAIGSERDYYSNVESKFLIKLIPLINKFPKVFELLNDSAKELIKSLIEKDADLFASAIFISDNLDIHVEKVLDITWDSEYENFLISVESILIIFEHLSLEKDRDASMDFIIEMFWRSNQYYVANDRFDGLIYPKLGEFNKQELKKIVEKIDDNSQIWERHSAKRTNGLVNDKIKSLYSDSFEYKSYPNFKY